MKIIVQAYRRFRNKLISLKIRTKWILVMCFLLVPLFSVFPATSIHSSVKNETIANKMAKVAKKDTTNGDYLSLVVESNDESKSPIRTPSVEFYSTLDMFRDSFFTYAGTINCDKKANVRIKEIKTENLSFLYSNVNSNKEYEDHYKHEFYDVELMFKGNHQFGGSIFSFCYLSESQAKKMLNYKHLTYTTENFESLLGTPLTLSINGKEYLFNIGNIYYEIGSFYEALKSTMGEFALTYSKHPDGVKFQSCYYMKDQEFQNLEFINRISSLYGNGNYQVKINHFNVKNEINDDELLSFLYGESPKNNDPLSITLVVIIILLFYISLYLVVVNDLGTNLKETSILVSVGLLPYIFYMIISKTTNYTACFSNIGTVIYFLLLLSFIGSVLICYISSLLSKKEQNTNE